MNGIILNYNYLRHLHYCIFASGVDEFMYRKQTPSILLLLLPSGSEQHEVLLFGSIQEGILQARHYIVQTEKHTKILV